MCLPQVLKESLRMFPVAATGLSRCADEDCVLGGYHIPVGTEIQVRSVCQAVCAVPCHVPMLSLIQPADTR